MKNFQQKLDEAFNPHIGLVTIRDGEDAQNAIDAMITIASSTQLAQYMKLTDENFSARTSVYLKNVRDALHNLYNELMKAA